MRILITGGAGYIAYNLINKLLEEEDVSAILIYDNLAYSSLNFLIGKRQSKVEFIEGDILDTPKLEKLLDEIDVVYHMAAYVQNAYNYMQSLQYYQVNQWGTLSLIRAVRKASTIKKFIYLSSTAVYGFKEDLLDNQPVVPLNDYAKSKYSGEKYVEGIEEQDCIVNIVRMANVYGYNPCFRRDSVINSFITEALLNKKILIYGDGSQKRAFAHIDKAALYLADLCTSASSKKLHIYHDFSASVSDIYEILLSEIPDLECSFVNQDIPFESQSFANCEMKQQHRMDILRTLHKFKENFRIVKN